MVDSTAQLKAIADPTDSRLLKVARRKLVDIAKSVGIDQQTFAKEGKQLTRKAGGYAHARQFRLMRKPIDRQRTIIGRLAREIVRRLATIAQDLKQSVLVALQKAKQLMAQTKHRKTKGVPKLYSWHAPEVKVIVKGEARTPYEFGVKVGITSTLKGYLILGARSVPNSPYDGHKLNEQLEQASIMSHLQSDHRMGRCHIKGEEEDAIHAVLCAAGYNIRWLMQIIRKKGIRFFCGLFSC